MRHSSTVRCLKTILVVGVAALLACVEPQKGAPPCAPDEQGDLIVGLIPGGGLGETMMLWAAKDCNFVEPIEISSEDRLLALLLERSLEDEQLEEGPLSLSEKGRPLPRSTIARRFDLDAGQWTEDASIPGSLEPLRIPELDIERCFRARRCPRLDGATRRGCFACSPLPPEPPALPSSPLLVPCPPGWSQAEGIAGAPAGCDPPLPPPPVPCGEVEAQHWGEASCARIGPSCPTGEFREDLPPGEVLYVKAGVPPGGTGSLADPFSSIAEALVSAAPGATIALSKGTHVGSALPGGLKIVGACAEQTEIIRATEAGFVVVDGHVEIESLHVRGAQAGFQVEGPSASLGLRGVVVTGGAQGLIVASAAELVAEDTLLRGQDGLGVHALEGRRVVLRRVVVEGSGVEGLTAQGGRLELEDVVVRNGAGRGLALLQGSETDARRILAEETRGSGVRASGASARLEDLIVRNTLPLGLEADGLLVESSSITVDRAFVADNQGAQIRIFSRNPEAPASASLSNLVAKGVTPGETSVLASGSASLALSRATLLSVEGIALHLDGVSIPGEPNALPSDVIVRNGASGSEEGSGIVLSGMGTSLVGDRLWVEGFKYGIALHDAVRAEIRDLSVRPSKNEGQGFALFSVAEEGELEGATLDVARALVEGGSQGGYVYQLGAKLRFEDWTVRGGDEGALNIRDSIFEGARISIEGATAFGLRVDTNSSAKITDLRVDEILDDGMDNLDCGGARMTGLCLTANARLELDRFEISRSYDRGFSHLPFAALSLRNGRFTENGVGIRWAESEEQLLQNIDSVQCYDNEIDLLLE